MDYSEFLTQLANTATYAVDDPDFLIMAPQALQYAELRLLRDIDPIAYREQRDVALPLVAQGVCTAPADTVIVRGVWYVFPGGARARLDRRDREFLNLYTPVPGTLGVPRYWASEDGETIVVCPIPPEDTTLKVDLTYRPAGMSASNPTTWLGTWAPDALFHAAMVFAVGFQRSFGEAQTVGADGLSWESSYQTALAGVMLEMRRRKADGPWDNSRIPPVSSITPPG